MLPLRAHTHARIYAHPGATTCLSASHLRAGCVGVSAAAGVTGSSLATGTEQKPRTLRMPLGGQSGGAAAHAAPTAAAAGAAAAAGREMHTHCKWPCLLPQTSLPSHVPGPRDGPPSARSRTRTNKHACCHDTNLRPTHIAHVCSKATPPPCMDPPAQAGPRHGKAHGWCKAAWNETSCRFEFEFEREGQAGGGGAARWEGERG